jgi:hypothetical protein
MRTGLYLQGTSCPRSRAESWLQLNMVVRLIPNHLHRVEDGEEDT